MKTKRVTANGIEWASLNKSGQASLLQRPLEDSQDVSSPVLEPASSAPPIPAPGANARRLMESLPGEPLWLCDWRAVVFLHHEVDPVVLQREVPFALDLFLGRAFVSLVAFTLTDMRPRFGGRLTRFLFKPFGTHRFLNARTYVQHNGQRGIYFLAEWLDAPRINRLFGPLLYGLPFCCGRLDYENAGAGSIVQGSVTDQTGSLTYSGSICGKPQSAAKGTTEEFLLERYRAFTCRHNHIGWFPVWHEPWRFAPLHAEIQNATLLTKIGAWHDIAQFHSAHWSPGADGVWMGWWRNDF